MQALSQTKIDIERRWNPGSWLALAFALFIFTYNLGYSIYSMGLPTDSWVFEGDQTANPPVLLFSTNLLNRPTLIKPDDKLVAVNNLALDQILDRQHRIFAMPIPDWPDGTVLHYEVLRDSQHMILAVPVSRATWWHYFTGMVRTQGTTGLVQVLGSLTFFIIGGLVFLLRPGNRAAHALLLVGVSFFFNAWPTNTSVPTLFYRLPPISIPLDTWTGAINPSLMYLVLVFPRPKWPVRRFPRLTVALLYLPWIAVFNLLYLLNLNNPEGYIQAAFLVYPVQIILLMVVTLGSLVHSGITVRDPVGRSQFKWMLAGIGGFVFMGVGGWLVTSYFLNGLEMSWLVTVSGWFLLPICLAIAITRYRLFDIDVFIRKTLVYSVLTAMLALVYFGSVVFVGQFTRSITGENSNLAVVVSTLSIAALFGPLRRWVQAAIDRRFYRRAYNAAQNIAAFGASVQNEVDMDKLTSELLSLVNETMQPASVSLWLKNW